MKRFIASLVVISQIAPVSAFAGGEKCAATCAEFESGVVKGQFNGRSESASDNPMSYGYVMGKCGQPKGGGQETQARDASNFVGQSSSGSASSSQGSSRTPDDSRGIDPSLRTGDEAWDACYARLRNRWNQVGPQCVAIKLDNQAQVASSILAGAYTLAAAGCTAACIAELTTGGIPWLAGACAIAGASAAVADISAALIIGKTGDQFTAAMSPITGMAGAAGSAVSQLAENTAGKTISSCVGAGLMVTAAISKWINMASLGGYADAACSNILSFGSLAIEADTYGDTGAPKGLGFTSQAQTSSSTTATSSGRSSSSANNPYVAFEDHLDENFIHPKFAASTASGDVFSKVFQELPREKLLEGIKQSASMSVGEMMKRLATQSPATVLGAAFPNMPPAASTAFKDLEKLVKEGKLSSLGASGGAIMTSGGGGKGAPAKPAGFQFPAFGAGISAAGGAPTEETFEKAKRDVASDSSGDIWHEGYAGTIFQIVSQKLVKNRDRIDQLEWETPLNRALMGLPAKKDSHKSSK